MTDADWKPSPTSIDEPIARDIWAYQVNGGSRETLIEVGKPAPIVSSDPKSEWYCPLRIEGQLPAIQVIVGLGPVDALMNAMMVVKRFFEETHRYARSATD